MLLLFWVLLVRYPFEMANPERGGGKQNTNLEFGD